MPPTLLEQPISRPWPPGCGGSPPNLAYAGSRLKDEDPLVRSYTAEAIAGLNVSEYVKTLRQASIEELDERAKVGISRALFQFVDSNRFSLLLQLLESKNYVFRCAAANTLTRLSLSRPQLKLIFVTLSHAAQIPIARAEESTMESVLKELLAENKTLDGHRKRNQ
jgi:HEAT repeat protein